MWRRTLIRAIAILPAAWIGTTLLGGNWTRSQGADSYENYRRGKEILADPKKLTPAGNEEARRLLTKAIELDPQFSRAYAELAYVHVREYQEGWSNSPNASLASAKELADQALKLAEQTSPNIDDDFDAHWNLASVYWNQGEFDKSFIEYNAAQKLKPDNRDLTVDMAEALIYAGESEKAIKQITEAVANNHEIPYWYWWNLGRAYYMAKRYQDAIDAIRKITDPPNDVRLITAASNAQLGNTFFARFQMEEFSKNDPEFSITMAAERHFRSESDREHWLDGLRKAGLKEK